MLKHYSVFGGCLESEVEFPELRPTERRAPLWHFATVAAAEEIDGLQEIGCQHIYADVHARLYRHSEGHRIVVDDTGTFDIDASGTSITCAEKDGAWPDFVRAHLLGRVLATSLFARGLLPLHGSAVEHGGGVMAFLAPKRFGKSTMALALTHAGAKLATDDTLPVELGSTVISWPGVHSIRVAADSLAAVGATADGIGTREGKELITSIAEDRLSRDPAPLTAIYVLNPVDSVQVATVERRRMPEVGAAVALVSNFKLARMTGNKTMHEVLARAAKIARAVPVYELRVPRNLESLPDVCNTILEWHSSGGRGTGSVPARAAST